MILKRSIINFINKEENDLSEYEKKRIHMFNIKAKNFPLTLIFSLLFIQSCGVTYSGMSGSSGGMSGSSGGMSGSSGGMSGSGNPIRGMGGQSAGGQGQMGGYPGETNSERQRRLEGELEKSVGGLDEVLGEEQRKIESVGRDTGGFGGNSSRGGVGLGKQANVGSQRNGSNSQQTGVGSTRQSSVGELSDEEIRARTPDDIPELVSEDVVSKQLREAAVSEDDPQLRERLWEEYRNYNRF